MSVLGKETIMRSESDPPPHRPWRRPAAVGLPIGTYRRLRTESRIREGAVQTPGLEPQDDALRIALLSQKTARAGHGPAIAISQPCIPKKKAT